MLKTIFSSLSALSILLFALLGCTRTAPAPAQDDRPPNIVFILADDLGYGDLGVYGQQLISTPVLDGLAARGMRFTNHYSGSTVCAPSRSVLMTGLHTGRTHIRGNIGGGDDWLLDSVVTVAEVLQDRGYHTKMIGKWGLGTEDSPGAPDRQGFDEYYGYLDQVFAHNYYPEFLMRDGKREYLDNEVVYLDSTAWHGGRGSRTLEKNTYSHDLFEEEALAYINRRAEQSEQPFFLYLPFTMPHNNGEEVKKEWYEIPDQGKYADKDWEKYEKDYAAMITRLDETVGRIVDRLTELGLRDNTLIVFTSDNGPIPNTLIERFNSNGPLRGGKRDLYEGGIRVPLIVNWLGQVPAGVVTDYVSSFQDWLPTLAAVGGDAYAGLTDGFSLLPTLTGEGEQEQHEFLYWEFLTQGGKLALRGPSWKAVKTNFIKQPNADWEFYDLPGDSVERNDVSAERPAVQSMLDSLFEVAHTSSALFPLTPEERR